MKINQIEQLTRQSHLNLYAIDYLNRENQKKTWVYASRKGNEKTEGLPDAVVLVPFHCQTGKLVIIEEFRVVLGGFQYGFPAGLVDPGETVADAGKRELFEETGLEMTAVLKQGPPVYSSSGMTDESVSLLFVECQGTPSSQYTEASEEIRVHMVSRDEARALLEDPHLKFDVKTWIILNTYAFHGILS